MEGSIDSQRREFADPPDEFSPIPFWFWNDAIDETELERQIRDFRSKGVAGFVIHPRMGLPREIPYLSDRFLGLVRRAVELAAGLGMRVVLYDEAMYPSGSAHGEVARRRPELAAHSLRMAALSMGEARQAEDGLVEGPALSPGEKIAAAFGARGKGSGGIVPGSLGELSASPGGRWRRTGSPGDPEPDLFLFFIETTSGGTIRGIHFGEDDGEPDAPPAADLLDPEAVAEFIRLTHERYYEALAPWFGSTIIAMFTDEPDIRGRRCKSGEQPWTPGFLRRYRELGGRDRDLAALWLDLGPETEAARRRFKEAIDARLAESYYRQLSDWCASHGIALAGHPAGSSDIAFESYFHIPGQDLVWRWVDPDGESALVGEHSTQARCSSDAARIAGRRRNANECFGCCGPEGNPWAFTAADMKWYLDWLFARGVNLIFPHAFFYSVAGEKRYGERPPDVGPNNIWWDDYPSIAAYIRRMCWLNTDSIELVDLAVLSTDDRLPWRAPRELYRRQAGFHYLPLGVLASGLCEAAGGAIAMRDYAYRVLLSEMPLGPGAVDRGAAAKIEAHIASGGRVVAVGPGAGEARMAGIDYAATPEEAALLAIALSGRAATARPFAPELRATQLRKGGSDFILLFNEGSGDIETNLLIPMRGSIERWDPWTGEIGRPAAASLDGSVAVRLGYRESLVLRVDRSRAPEELPLDGWRRGGPELPGAALLYETTVECERVEEGDRWVLDCGEVGEIARLRVNGREAGSRLWKPYRFELAGLIARGRNELSLEVRPSLCAKYGSPGPAEGLVGPARLVRIPAP